MRRLAAALTLVLALAFVAGLGYEAWGAISISLTGGWSETLNASDLSGGAGSDLISTYESAVDAVSLTISGATGGSDAWRLDVRKADATWHGDLVLSVKRTSAGSRGSVSGGSDYQLVNGVSHTFFSGAGDVSGIGVRLKLSGVSIKVPPASYSTAVYYTVVDE